MELKRPSSVKTLKAYQKGREGGGERESDGERASERASERKTEKEREKIKLYFKCPGLFIWFSDRTQFTLSVSSVAAGILRRQKGDRNNFSTFTRTEA